ncbi:MAG: prolyl oligopeptidase family serine peptidase [Acidobacteria bacterium]|nr:prolyl oligopeptidase family serine peptidase [Acidobacteriota bacterium]
MRVATLLLLWAGAVCAQTAGFQWVNPMPTGAHPALRHGTYHSKVNDVEVGYVIYLPPGYEAAANASRRYPVVYYLHGGRPGSETKSIGQAKYIDDAMQAGKVPPMIYVFVNGGCVSHYDHQGCLGETTFIKELIPYVDQTYRTIAKPAGRGLEGFSQGGRGTARIMFKHPELFASAAPMGGGHQYEKTISENNGAESAELVIDPPTNNTWDLAKEYAAKRMKKHPLPILVVVGTKDQNYQPNLEWMAHLTKLGIPFQKIIVPDTPHSAREVYEKHGVDAMMFHVANFRKALGKDW